MLLRGRNINQELLFGRKEETADITTSPYKTINALDQIAVQNPAVKTFIENTDKIQKENASG